MAGDAPFPSFICMTLLFFSLLLAFHFAMAVPERSLSTLTFSKEDAKKRSTMVASSAREGSTQNQKITEITPKQSNNHTHVYDLLKAPKGRRGSRAPRPPLQWQNKIFNVSEHEVPSGPNPISNR